VAQLDVLLDLLADQLNLDEAAWNSLPPVHFTAAAMAESTQRLLHGKTVAVAHDAAFAFLYPANLACLRDLGATVVFFSPLADEAIPDSVDAAYLPGGYPELHAQTLAVATRWQESMHAAHAAGMPLLAECGGMMALVDTLVDKQGRAWRMAGLMPGQVAMQKRLAAIGAQAWETGQGTLRGHAFHYSRLDTAQPVFAHARKQAADVDGEPIYRIGSLTASYFHAYFPSCPQAVAALLLGEGRP
jgi:cobyrinic acid a,c-diamide synthase